MGVLEQVIKLKNQGTSDLDIINNLAQQGISPKEIDAALKQAQIKNAVSSFNDEEMQPSIMPDENPQPEQQPAYSPQQEYTPQADQQYSDPSQQQAQQQYYSPQQYSQQPYQEYQNQTTNTDTMIEIADQIFADKIRKFQKQFDSTIEMSSLLQGKVENMNERLKKIEAMIDKLQIAILEKVGSYGQNLEGIKKEMSMMQDSFTKMVTPQREAKKQPESISEKLRKI